MKIVVAMKQIADLQQIRIKDRKPVIDDAPLTLGKIDKNALEAAVQLKEINDGEVIVVSAGNEDLEDTIKEALAADADRAVLLLDNEAKNMDSSQTAIILSKLIKRVEDYDLIIFGEGSGDNYSGQMGSRVAELLNLPQVGYVSEISVNGNVVRAVRSLEDVSEVVEVEMPAVISVAADLNEPRIPAVSKILKAGRKPKDMVDLSELEVDIGNSQVQTISNLAPIMNRKGIEIKNVTELVNALKSEGLWGGKNGRNYSI